MWKFVRQQNIEHYRRQIAETSDPFRRARLQLLLEEELGKIAAPTNGTSVPSETVRGMPDEESD